MKEADSMGIFEKAGNAAGAEDYSKVLKKIEEEINNKEKKAETSEKKEKDLS